MFLELYKLQARAVMIQVQEVMNSLFLVMSLVGICVHFPLICTAELFHALFSMSNYLNLIEGTQQKEARNPMKCDYQQEEATREKERVIFTIKTVRMQPVLMRKHTFRMNYI